MPVVLSVSSQKYFRAEDRLKDDQAQSYFPKGWGKVDSGKSEQVCHLLPQIYFAEELRLKPGSPGVQTPVLSGVGSLEDFLDTLSQLV